MPLSEDPFCEVDNLILAMIAYADLSGIVPADAGVPIRAARDGYFGTHSREEMKKSKSIPMRAPLLLDGIADGERFRGTEMCFFSDTTDKTRDLQFSAVTFRLADGSSYVAFRGTDGTLTGWREDFDLSFLEETEGQKLAVGYLNAVGDRTDGPITVGGHSKGGNLAVYAAAFCEKEVKDRITAVYSNDGPGFRRAIAESEEYASILPRVVSIVPDTSLVGQLLTSKSEPVVVKSSALGIAQHNGMTWSVVGNRFERCAMSPVGRLIGMTAGAWLEQMDDGERRFFTDAVFSVFESTGADTFSEMGDQKLKSAESIVNAVLAMPKDDHRKMRDILRALGQSGGKAATDLISEKRTNKE